MLRLYNSLGKKTEVFHPANRNVVTIFTCGPSVYQRAHIGNFRTFLFEDILARYLEYSGYRVRRGMNITDIEDKAIIEAEKKKIAVKRLTGQVIKEFKREMKALRMKPPDFLPKASESISETVAILEVLLDRGIAYRYGRNVYFDALKFPGFGKIYGIDTSTWPAKKKRFHKDTYPGTRWNKGDFILWHGCNKGDRYCWDTVIGKGRPAWNIQDPGMISRHFDETLSVYCGGIDNLFRHHDYTCAILESVRPYPLAKFWLHCHHLHVKGRKMSKSRGNILYTDMLKKQGYAMAEIRFFLIYGHYRRKLNYSGARMRNTAEYLKTFRGIVKNILNNADRGTGKFSGISRDLKKTFIEHMDNDLDVKGAFDGLFRILSSANARNLNPSEASGIIRELRKTDEVFQCIF